MRAAPPTKARTRIFPALPLASLSLAGSSTVHRARTPSTRTLSFTCRSYSTLTVLPARSLTLEAQGSTTTTHRPLTPSLLAWRVVGRGTNYVYGNNKLSASAGVLFVCVESASIHVSRSRTGGCLAVCVACVFASRQVVRVSNWGVRGGPDLRSLYSFVIEFCFSLWVVGGGWGGGC